MLESATTQPFSAPQQRDTPIDTNGEKASAPVKKVPVTVPTVSSHSCFKITGFGGFHKVITKLSVMMNYMKEAFIGLCCGGVSGGFAGAIGGGLTGAAIGIATTGGVGALPMAIIGATTGGMCVGSCAGGTGAVFNVSRLYIHRMQEQRQQEMLNNEQ